MKPEGDHAILARGGLSHLEEVRGILADGGLDSLEVSRPQHATLPSSRWAQACSPLRSSCSKAPLGEPPGGVVAGPFCATATMVVGPNSALRTNRNRATRTGASSFDCAVWVALATAMVLDLM